MATRSISKGTKQPKKGESSGAKAKPAGASRPEASAAKTNAAADGKAKQPAKSKVEVKSKTDGRKSAHGGDGETRATAPRRAASDGHGSDARAESKRPSASTEPKKHRSKESRKTGKSVQGGNGHIAPGADSKSSGKRRQASPESRKDVPNRGIERMPVAGPDATEVASTLHRAMESHADAHSLGHVTREARFDWGEIENPDLHPALAFVSFDRWAAYRHVPSSLTWHVVPDLVVEVLAEAEKTEEIGPRLSDYFKAGVNRVWVVYPRDMRVFDYQSASEYEILSGNDRLSGGKILPGFELALKELEKGHE